jgi:hypothetical protein
MDVTTVVLGGLLCLSIIINALLVFGLIHFRQLSKTKRVESIEAVELLHDLTAHGKMLVKVSRVDPNDVLLRSPRDQ